MKSEVIEWLFAVAMTAAAPFERRIKAIELLIAMGVL